ncbi:hypothetical protein GOP47_0020174, partial [Adiantum capillus-veneris]
TRLWRRRPSNTTAFSNSFVSLTVRLLQSLFCTGIAEKFVQWRFNLLCRL